MSAPYWQGVMDRHDFLARMHEIIKPKVYLEIGVQTGASLNLAKAAEVAIGIDPAPLIGANGNQVIYEMTSNEYFSHDFRPHHIPRDVDFAFIDGDHTYDQALVDFYNIQELYGHNNTIMAFDDVLPYAQEVGTREYLGSYHWAGDVWRAEEVLVETQPSLNVTLVNVVPTGLLLVWDLIPRFRDWELVLDKTPLPVPEHVINRTYAVSADFALELLAERVGSV